jgi:hypothetical protein
VIGFGKPVSFSVTASGQAPFTYQWQFDGTNILNATNATHFLTSTSLTNIGYYHVFVGNSIGSTVSSNASLAFLNIAEVPVLAVYGPAGASYEIESSTNLATWNSLTNVTLSATQPYVYYVNYSIFLANPNMYYQAIPQ